MRLKKAAVGAWLLVSLWLAMFPEVSVAQSVEDVVRTYFQDAPVMAEIARCESKFRQFNDVGEPLHGGMGGKMIGIYQIYEDIHADYAKGLGMDIYATDGNLQYARLLYNRSGTEPWMSSFPCWGKEIDIATRTGDLTVNLSLGMEHSQVLVLQKLLNSKGYLIATEGPGSPGQETQKFGAFTRAAVRKFQCAIMQICEGDEYTNGYGFVGSKTRAAIASDNSVAPPSQPQTTASSTSEYSSEQQAQIAALQAQIVELTKILTALLAARQN